MRRFQDNPQLEALTKNPTLNGKYFLMARMGKELQMNRQQFSWYSLGFNDKLTYEPLPRRAAKGYITIHDGFDLSNRHIVTGRATKTWDWAHWNQFVYIFKEMFPRVKVIQLGRADTARAIDGVDECLIDETTITEAFDILSRSSLHIDGDSGLLHAATRMQIPTIGIYGPSDPAFYGYPQNMNLRSGVCEQFCNGSKDTWMDKCAIGYTTPKCMDATTPTRVLEVVKQFFNSEGTKNEISKTADSYRRIPMVEARRCSGSD
jgi:ADP-heptose:LPS heptosyltransferase